MKKTSKLSPAVFTNAAIEASEQTVRYDCPWWNGDGDQAAPTGYMCNAIKYVTKKDWEPYIEFFENLFKPTPAELVKPTSAELGFNSDSVGYHWVINHRGFWGNCFDDENVDARVIAALLCAEMLKKSKKRKKKV